MPEGPWSSTPICPPSPCFLQKHTYECKACAHTSTKKANRYLAARAGVVKEPPLIPRPRAFGDASATNAPPPPSLTCFSFRACCRSFLSLLVRYFRLHPRLSLLFVITRVALRAFLILLVASFYGPENTKVWSAFGFLGGTWLVALTLRYASFASHIRQTKLTGAYL